MFGYLIASASGLTPEQLERYKSCYCGLCRSLKKNHGELSRLTLNYDMTFLVLLLQSLYESDSEKGKRRCIAHPLEEREYEISEATDYAADMLVILSYYKLLDDWKDEGSLSALLSSKVLGRKIITLREKYPRQYSAVDNGIRELSELEETECESADAVAAAFGKIMAEIFVWKEDRWRDCLYSLGDNLGRFIYLEDAAVDLSADIKNNRYNPFKKYENSDNNYDNFKQILKLFLSDAIIQFEYLPLVEDTGIMKNILCSGLWTKFEEKYGSLQSTRGKQ